MTHDTRTEAEALLAAVEKMTPGPWRPSTWQNENGDGWSACGPFHSDGEEDGDDETRAGYDAAGIVALRNHAPAIIRALLAEVERLHRELERHRHGTTIEGDAICPAALELADAWAERDAARAVALEAIDDLRYAAGRCEMERDTDYVHRRADALSAALTGAKP